MSNTVLVVDDNDEMRDIIERMLILHGYTVTLAEDGEQGLRLAQLDPPDLIISDIMMPRLNGHDFLRRLRKDPNLRDLPFIFVTAKHMREDIQLGLTLGAEHYLTKPFSPQELLDAIESVFEKRTIIRGEKKGTSSDIFISHSHEDDSKVTPICESLRAANFSVWVDTENVEPGTPSWKGAIQDAIDGCGCVVVLLSPNAKRSKWVVAELDYAEIQEKRIYPTIIEGTVKSAVPFGLTMSHWVDLQEDYEAAMDRLITSLKKHLRRS